MFQLSGQSKLVKHILAQDWEAAILLLEAKPKEAKKWSRVHFDGDRETDLLPLHQACFLCPPTSVVEALLAAYPSAANEKESFFRRMPVHIACLNGASVDVVDVLLSSSRGATTRDALGRVPLHYAVFSPAPYQMTSMLLQTCPDGARMQDNRGWLPIHVAVRYNAKRDVLKVLHKVYPECSRVKTNNDMTPLGCAEKFGVSQDMAVLSMLKNDGRSKTLVAHARPAKALTPGATMVAVGRLSGNSKLSSLEGRPKAHRGPTRSSAA